MGSLMNNNMNNYYLYLLLNYGQLCLYFCAVVASGASSIPTSTRLPATAHY